MPAQRRLLARFGTRDAAPARRAVVSQTCDANAALNRISSSSSDATRDAAERRFVSASRIASRSETGPGTIGMQRTPRARSSASTSDRRCRRTRSPARRAARASSATPSTTLPRSVCASIRPSPVKHQSAPRSARVSPRTLATSVHAAFEPRAARARQRPAQPAGRAGAGQRRADRGRSPPHRVGEPREHAVEERHVVAQSRPFADRRPPPRRAARAAVVHVARDRESTRRSRGSSAVEIDPRDVRAALRVPARARAPRASRKRAPSAASAPAPPSVVALPPIPSTMRVAPRVERVAQQLAGAARRRAPRVERRAPSSASPDAAAISTIAVSPSRAYVASTGSPSGPVTRTVRGVAPLARNASTVPSPPSAIGTSSHARAGEHVAHARGQRGGDAGRVELPLNLSGATTTRTPAHGYCLRQRDVDRDRSRRRRRCRCSRLAPARCSLAAARRSACTGRSERSRCGTYRRCRWSR